MAAGSGQSLEAARVVWIIATLSLMEILFILYMVVKDMIKNVRTTFVIKDHFTVYFIIYVLLALGGKIFILDTYYKD